VFGIVSGQQGALRLDHLDVDELIALALDAREDLAREVAGNAVRLDENEGFFARDGHVGVLPDNGFGTASL
jgi:hypothetical protein